MPPSQKNATEILTGYYEADAKYVVAPVPTTLEAQVDQVTDFIRDKTTPTLSARRVERLSRLAVYYDTGPAAAGFLEMFNKRETSNTDYFRSAQAIVAVAWIGGRSERKTAQDYYQSLLRRAKPLEHRDAMLSACSALGPDEGTDRLRKWIDTAVADYDKRQADATANGDEGAAEAAWADAENLRDFLRQDVAAVEREFDVRRQLDSAKPDVQVMRMAGLYTGDAADTSPRLGYWAAMKLVRTARKGPGAKSRIAERFAKLAQGNARTDAARQNELNSRRIRGLWAAELMGHHLDKESSDWLAQQKDPGTDVLVLRADWEYPAYLDESEAEGD
ncbi:MAG: hypothetical protein GY778_08825 [bacterium]|nr:hypothetical protein [bacterium]